MASTLQDFEGWEIVKRDENGSILDDEFGVRRVRRRNDRSSGKEYVSIKRVKDNMEFGCGDSIVMQDAETNSYSAYMVHEIRLNTLNHWVEIWAFGYLQKFELDEREYLEACEEIPASKLQKMPDAQVAASFEKICNSNELFLTAELTELLLVDFVCKAKVCDTEEFPAQKLSTANDDDTINPFLVRFACEPTGMSFRKIEIHDVEQKVARWDSRESHTFLKELTIEPVQDKGKKRLTHTLKSPEDNKSANLDTAAKKNTNDAIGTGSAKDAKGAKSVKDAGGTKNAKNTKRSKDAGDVDEAKDSSSSEGSEGFQDASEDLDISKKHARQEVSTEKARLGSDGSDKDDSAQGERSSESLSDEEEEDDDDEDDEEFLASDDKEVDADSESLDSDEELEMDSDNDNSNSSQKEEGDSSSDEIPGKRPRPLYRSASRGPQKRKDLKKPAAPSSSTKKSPKSSTSGLGGIKKYSKKNVSRAKKAYTPFSKRFKKTQDIPDLTEIAEFNQDQIDMDVAAIENRLRSPKKQHTTETIFSKVKKQLYTSHGKDEIMKAGNFDDYLPARENEFASIYLSLYSAIEAGTGTTVYVAGTPGVGKTLTVREVVKELLKSVEQNELPNFQYAEVNGLKMIKPTDSYEVLWNKISGERLTSGAAMESLEFYFNKVPKNKKRPILVLLDELDALVTKSQDVMYNFFNWTTYANAKLIVIAVANTMDLPEKQLGNKVSSRIGFTRIMFTGYTHEELKTIINLRLKGLNGSYFYVDVANGSARIVSNEDDNPSLVTSGMRKVKLKIAPDAVEIASRKIASVSGDARRALKACKRAVEIAEHEYMERHGYGYDGVTHSNNSKPNGAGSILTEDDEVQSVQINHIMKALNETVNSPVVSFMASLPFTTKLFLYAMINLIRKTGCQEQPLGDIIDEIKSSIDANGKNKFIVEMQRVLFNQDEELSLEQLRIISWEFLVNQLIEAGIVIRQNLKNERLSAVKLNVSTEDVKYALDQDKVMKTL
ncbi:LAFA_0G13168g1_1 [Lachancea sp. 'fantastica']|nr:LAFA_0G13168g1_1 [Lachancea sp. 'fantastica']